MIAFFLAEMGDKTQIATVALAARTPDAMWAVIAGTTVGMMIANVPAVLLGDPAHRIPVKLVHGIAAGIFAVLGVLTPVWGQSSDQRSDCFSTTRLTRP